MYPLLVTTLLLGWTVFLICAWFVRRPKNLPPGPWSIPIIGYVQTEPGAVYEHLTKLSQRYGPIFSLRRGTRLVVVLSDKHTITEALVKNPEVFSDRFVPGHTYNFLAETNRNATTAWSSGEPWLKLRRFGLTSLRTFGMGKKSLEPQISMEAKYLCEELDRSRGAAQYLQVTLSKATANIISQLSYNQRYDHTDQDYHRLILAMLAALNATTSVDPSTAFPILLKTPWYKELRENQAALKAYMCSHVDSHKKSFQADNIRDITDAFISDDISKDFSLDVFWRILVDFFAAGTETTSTFLSWTILYLAVHPDIQKKVHDELDTVIGRSRQPTLADRPNLPYCDATIHETTRIRPPLPLSLPHRTSRDITFESYTIPKDTIILPNLWAVHHNPEEWENPEVFDPERFLTDGGRTLKKIDAWMPFGVGRRECLGAQLAKMEMFIFFTNLFQRFEFKLPPDQPNHSMEGNSASIIPPKPYKVCAIER